MRRHLPLLAICLGYLMVIVDATIVNVALPSVGRELGGGVSGLQWVIDAYTVVFAALLLPAGSLGDRLGARRVFNAGLSLLSYDKLEQLALFSGRRGDFVRTFGKSFGLFCVSELGRFELGFLRSPGHREKLRL